MERKFVTIAVAFLSLVALVTPAFAGAGTDSSAKPSKSCEQQAADVRPALTAEQVEAFIADCKANATATEGKK